MSTYTEALETQCKTMLNIARRLDEKGYAVIVQGRANIHMVNAAASFFYTFAKEQWGEGPLAQRIKPIFVHVYTKNPAQPKDTMTSVICMFPNRRHYKPIITSLMMFSRKRKHRSKGGGVEGAGFIEAETDSNWVHFRATNNDCLSAFEVIVRHLEMPQHRKILLGQ